MALDDFRRWLDVQAQDGAQGSVALEAANGRDVLTLTVSEGASVDLDYSDAGMLLDWLREGMGILLARQGNPVAAAAVAGLEAERDTPPES